MDMAVRQWVPAVHEPRTHNHLIGNLAALDDAMDRDGYWFFRDVLDKGAVARLRRLYTEELEKLGVIDPVGDADTSKSVPYNGRGDVAAMPIHMEPLAGRHAWQRFVAEQPIHDFLVSVLGEKPFWKPVTEYRATAPDPTRSPDRITGWHQDGPPTPGVDFMTMWVPVAEVDWNVGGILFAEGHADPVNMMRIDETGTNKSIPPETLPDDGYWCHTTYRPGDVLFMNRWTPHSGMTNISDRFRLSFDHRVMRRGARRPIIGHIVSIAPDFVEVKDANGVTGLRIDDTTYARTTLHQRLHGQEIVEEFTPGKRVIVGHDNGVATVLRPTHQD